MEEKRQRKKGLPHWHNPPNPPNLPLAATQWTLGHVLVVIFQSSPTPNGSNPLLPGRTAAAISVNNKKENKKKKNKKEFKKKKKET